MECSAVQCSAVRGGLVPTCTPALVAAMEIEKVQENQKKKTKPKSCGAVQQHLEGREAKK